MKNKRSITLGSLFDGIGGFPYAGIFFGIKPLWASEIMPQAISVTQCHFPDMEHVGDITALHGGKLAPVDVITFGSPCQDLSVAGKRAGLCGERSGLFAEAIRIIDEMREATNGEYPRYAVWENVPGAFSSNAGLDYKAVLEAFTKTEVPIPGSGKWANAGMVRSGGIDIAWCVYNAQHFGVAQRRRRVFLVCDFGGRSAGEILFIEKSLSGYFAACREKGQRLAADAARSVIFAKPETGNCMNPWDTQQSRIFTEDGRAPTLAGADGGGGRNPAGLVVTAAYRAGESAKVQVINDQGGNNLDAEKSDISPTLRSEMRGNLPIVSVRCSEPVPISDKATRHNGGGITRNGDGAGNGLGVGKSGDPAPTITSGDRHAVAAYCLQGGMIGRQDHNGPRGNGINEDVCFTLNTVDQHAVFSRQRSDAFLNNDVTSTQTARQCKDATDLVVNVATVDCRNYCENKEISGTLQAKTTQGYSLNYQNPVRFGYIVRRLTPLECERLQGYPDEWTKYGHDGKPISDTRRYQMLGNSVAVPCVAYILMGIAEQMRPKKEAASLGKCPSDWKEAA